MEAVLGLLLRLGLLRRQCNGARIARLSPHLPDGHGVRIWILGGPDLGRRNASAWRLPQAIFAAAFSRDDNDTNASF